MLIPCDQIQSHLTDYLKTKVINSQVKSKLLAILVGDEPSQLSYVRIKRKIAQELGVGFEFLQLAPTLPSPEILRIITEKSSDPSVTGVIVQQPVPQDIDMTALYACIPTHKDIEGLSNNNVYIFPLVQACMIGLDWAYQYALSRQTPSLNRYQLPFDLGHEVITWLRRKDVTIAGSGITTGQPLARHFSKLQIAYHQTDSKSQNPDDVYIHSDIIISGVGKKIISNKNIKRGVILLNFGLRRVEKSVNNSHLRGDYDEEEIRNKAELYSQTPHGLGPIDVLCLYGNLLS